jgi:putative ABC transport system permease protein
MMPVAVASGLRNRFRNSLVVVELALSLVVLVGAGLLCAAICVQQVDPGFHAEKILAMNLSLPDYKYPKGPIARLL